MRVIRGYENGHISQRADGRSSERGGECRFHLAGTGSDGAYEADCIEEKIELCAEAEELCEGDRRKLCRRWNGGGT